MARWAMLVFIYGSHRHSEGEGQYYRGKREILAFWFAIVATLAPATYFLGRTALWIGLSLSILVSALSSSAPQANRRANLSDNYGAVVEVSEALSLCCWQRSDSQTYPRWNLHSALPRCSRCLR